MSTSTSKLAVGALLFLACSVAVVAVGIVDLPLLVGSVAVLGLAAGSLLVGTSENGRPV